MTFHGVRFRRSRFTNEALGYFLRGRPGFFMTHLQLMMLGPCLSPFYAAKSHRPTSIKPPIDAIRIHDDHKPAWE